MWIVVMLLMSPVYVGLIVGGRVAMKRGRDNDRPGFRALGVGLVGSGVFTHRSMPTLISDPRCRADNCQ